LSGLEFDTHKQDELPYPSIFLVFLFL